MISNAALAYGFLAGTTLAASLSAQTPTVKFRDVSAASAFAAALADLMAHGAAWGDYDGDGRPDLYVGGFADRPDRAYGDAGGPPGNRLLRNVGDGKFERIRMPSVEMHARTSGALFVDLDGDRQPELYVANNALPRSRRTTEPQRTAQLARSRLLRNRDSTFVDVSANSGAAPESLYTARNIGVLDYDRDGRLDLLLVEGSLRRRAARTRLLRNQPTAAASGLRFVDVSEAAGLPSDLHGLGLAIADLNGDDRPDFFAPFQNRLFLSAGPANRYAEAAGLAEVFQHDARSREDWACGAAFGDLDGDGDLDLVVSNHHVPARNRVFLNTSIGAEVRFREVTAAAGFGTPVPTKCPHVEIQDFDNDGRMDVYFSAAFETAAGSDAGVVPLIYRNVGARDGVPRFEPPRPIEGPMHYYPAGPSADFDGDGRLDLALVNWFASQRSRLLRNVGGQGRFLDVVIADAVSGIGAKVQVFAKDGALLGTQQIQIGFGYASGHLARCHFGLGRFDLGDDAAVDVVVRHADGNVERHRTKTNRTLRLRRAAPEQAIVQAKVRSHPITPRPAKSRRVRIPTDALLVRPDGVDPTVRVAAKAPTVDVLTFEGLPQTSRKTLWSNWGDSIVGSDGRYYTSIGDHRGFDGTSRLYSYDPESQELTRIADVAAAIGQPDGAYGHGKIHSGIHEDAAGWLWFSTYWGKGRQLEKAYAQGYAGSLLMRYHPARGLLQDLGAIAPEQGLPASAFDASRGRLFFHAVHSEDVVVFDTQRLRVEARGGAAGKLGRRAFLIGADGRAYFSGADRKLRFYDPTTNRFQGLDIQLPAAPRTVPERPRGNRGAELRAATRPTQEGVLFGVTARGILFRFDPREGTVRSLGPNWNDGIYTADLLLSPDEQSLYYVPGAHGAAARLGTPLVRFDVRTRQREVVAFLHAPLRPRLSYHLGGTYSLTMDRTGRRIFATFNGAPIDARARKQPTFGLPCIVVITLPD